MRKKAPRCPMHDDGGTVETFRIPKMRRRRGA